MIKNIMFDYKLTIGLLLAHFLTYVTFMDEDVFWYMLSGTILIFISYSLINDQQNEPVPFFNSLLIGIITGSAMYGLFYIGATLVNWLDLGLAKELSKLYKLFAPTMLFHYIVLLFIIIPGEEIFWRGFVLKKLLLYIKPWMGVFLSSLLYASVQIYSGYILLAIAALIGGIIWGLLYTWKRSLLTVIISHLIFDVLLLFLLPLV